MRLRETALRCLLSVVLVAWGASLFLAGCGDDGPGGRANQPPTAELTTGPVEGDTLDYRLRAFWTGSDPDGVIVRYEYAVDPPEVFTEAEIADPENSPGVQTAVLPGSGGDIGRLRVSKTVGGEEHSFDWVRTLAFNHEFAFSATEWDSAGHRRPWISIPVVTTARFYGMHRLYVRAVDDDGAASAPDRVAFTARTVAPSAAITKPRIAGDFLNIGSRITVGWSGTDPDPATSGGDPVGFLYRFLDLRGHDPPIPVYMALPDLLFDPEGAESVWTYVSAETLSTTFFPEVPGSYIVGVRAVDEAGAVEPFLDFGRNCFKFMTLASNGYPVVVLEESMLGQFTFKGSPNPYVVETMEGVPLRFHASGNAEEYGGTIAAMRWGVDLADLDVDEEWSDWVPVGALPEITLTAGIHVLYVQVSDDEDAVTLATVVFDVVRPSFDRDVLRVDDVRDQLFPRDVEHDAFWMELFGDSGRFGEGAVDIWETHGLNDTYSRWPIPPELSDLARYRLVVWENYGSGYNGVSGLWDLTYEQPILGAYLRAGGQLWVGGALTVAAMMPGNHYYLGADFTYPKIDLEGAFACRFMKLCSTKILNAMGGVTPGTSTTDNMVGAAPFPGRSEVYPGLEMDPEKVSPFKNSISHADAVFDPILLHGQPGFSGVLDSLYAYRAVNPQSDFQDKLCAVRWHDPDPAREQGRTQWFGFPLYYMRKEQAQETFNRSIDWFREEPSP